MGNATNLLKELHVQTGTSKVLLDCGQTIRNWRILHDYLHQLGPPTVTVSAYVISCITVHDMVLTNNKIQIESQHKQHDQENDG